MDTQLITTFDILGIVLILFLKDKVPADLVALLVVVAAAAAEDRRDFVSTGIGGRS